MAWQKAWQLVKDVLMTLTGLGLIISQLPAKDPSGTLVVAGLALLVPAVGTHAQTLLSGPSWDQPGGHGQSSPPESSPSSSPSSPPPESADEQQ